MLKNSRVESTNAKRQKREINQRLQECPRRMETETSNPVEVGVVRHPRLNRIFRNKISQHNFHGHLGYRRRQPTKAKLKAKQVNLPRGGPHIPGPIPRPRPRPRMGPRIFNGVFESVLSRYITVNFLSC